MKKQTEFKIERGVAIPESGARGPLSKYPLRKLQIGESFLITEGKNLNAVRARMRNLALNISPKFKAFVAVVEGGYRVWRLEDKP